MFRPEIMNIPSRAIVKFGVRELIRRRSCVALDCRLYVHPVTELHPIDQFRQPLETAQPAPALLFWALMPSLKIIESIASRVRHPLVRSVRCLMVAKVDSIGLLVRM
jgi:hypothetical protein